MTTARSSQSNSNEIIPSVLQAELRIRSILFDEISAIKYDIFVVSLGKQAKFVNATNSISELWHEKRFVTCEPIVFHQHWISGKITYNKSADY